MLTPTLKSFPRLNPVGTIQLIPFSLVHKAVVRFRTLRLLALGGAAALVLSVTGIWVLRIIRDAIRVVFYRRALIRDLREMKKLRESLEEDLRGSRDDKVMMEKLLSEYPNGDWPEEWVARLRRVERNIEWAEDIIQVSRENERKGWETLEQPMF
jgi:heme exporter protein D